MTTAQLQQLVTLLFNFLQNHPDISINDIRIGLEILDKRAKAAQQRDSANADAQQYGLPNI